MSGPLHAAGPAVGIGAIGALLARIHRLHGEAAARKRSSRRRRRTSCASCCAGSTSFPLSGAKDRNALDAVIHAVAGLRGAGRRVGGRDPARASRRLRFHVARRLVSVRTGGMVRLSRPASEQPGRARAHSVRHPPRCSPAALPRRSGAASRAAMRAASRGKLASAARRSLDFLSAHGASFYDEIVRWHRAVAHRSRGRVVRARRARPRQLRQLRRPGAPCSPRRQRSGKPSAPGASHRRALFGIEDSGRWSLLNPALCWQVRLSTKPRSSMSCTRSSRRLWRRVLAAARAGKRRGCRRGAIFLRVLRRLEARGDCAAAVSSLAFSGGDASFLAYRCWLRATRTLRPTMPATNGRPRQISARFQPAQHAQEIAPRGGSHAAFPLEQPPEHDAITAQERVHDMLERGFGRKAHLPAQRPDFQAGGTSSESSIAESARADGCAVPLKGLRFFRRREQRRAGRRSCRSLARPSATSSRQDASSDLRCATAPVPSTISSLEGCAVRATGKFDERRCAAELGRELAARRDARTCRCGPRRTPRSTRDVVTLRIGPWLVPVRMRAVNSAATMAPVRRTDTSSSSHVKFVVVRTRARAGFSASPRGGRRLEALQLRDDRVRARPGPSRRSAGTTSLATMRRSRKRDGSHLRRRRLDLFWRQLSLSLYAHVGCGCEERADRTFHNRRRAMRTLKRPLIAMLPAQVRPTRFRLPMRRRQGSLAISTAVTGPSPSRREARSRQARLHGS